MGNFCGKSRFVSRLDRSDGPGIKSTLGTELQSLTESQVFRLPSTFTFIFRAIASIDGIGKGLDEDYDLGEFAQPFVTKLIDKVKYGGDNSKKSLAVFGKATGLNAEDVNTALTQPRKIAYLEDYEKYRAGPAEDKGPFLGKRNGADS